MFSMLHQKLIFLAVTSWLYLIEVDCISLSLIIDLILYHFYELTYNFYKQNVALKIQMIRVLNTS